MTFMDELRETSTKTTTKLLSSEFPSTIGKINDLIASDFPHGPGDLSSAEAAFRNELEQTKYDGANGSLTKAISSTRNALSLGISHLQILEKHIALHVPQMEDGNNFGVTVQMTIAKFCKETREEWEKQMLKIPAYYKDRADCIEKIKLPSTIGKSTIHTQSQSNTKGGKDGDEDKTSTSTLTEEKTMDTGRDPVNRFMALLAIDVQFYYEMRTALVALLDGYYAILDVFDKNRDKLEHPKGSGGHMGNAMSMY